MEAGIPNLYHPIAPYLPWIILYQVREGFKKLFKEI